MKKQKISSVNCCRTLLTSLISLGFSGTVVAGCDITQPTSGQSVTCSVSTPNPSVTGVTAVTGSDNVTVNIDTGTILNLSDQNGVLIYSNSSVFQRGTLNISNDSFDGISSSLSGNVIENFGTINTQSVESEALFISGTDNQAINQSGGMITTSGDDSSGMISLRASTTDAGDNQLTNAGMISTSGAGSTGMFAQGTGNRLTNTGSISTTGDNASGMQVNGNGNLLDNRGTIVTQGRAANGINAGGGTELESVTNAGAITTSGVFANGVYFDNAGTFTNAADGNITSSAARGVLATAGGTLTNHGEIRAWRDGIDSYYGVATITNTGSITSDNERAVLSTATTTAR